MSKSRVLIPVLAGAAALGAVAYAFSRSSKRMEAVHSSEGSAEAALRESMMVPRGDVARTEFALDLDGIFDADPDDALEHTTVHADTRVPALASADDAEPPAPEDLGAYWLSRATDSERSRDESDLELELDGLVDPAEPADSVDDADPDERDDDDQPAANDVRAV